MLALLLLVRDVELTLNVRRFDVFKVVNRETVHCSSSPTLHNEVKDMYISAVKASPQDVDADVQVGAAHC